MTETCFPEKIRVSTGSAIILRILRGKLDAKPTTAYLLICRKEKCSANCGFCPQASKSKGRADRLSRVTWPAFPTVKVVENIEKAAKAGTIKRVCVQALNYPEFTEDVLSLVSQIKSKAKIPVSVSCKPISRKKMEKWANAGVNRLSIPLDATTEQIFCDVKGQKIGGPYSWENQNRALKMAVDVFGRGKVSTHLIVGLGETEKELCRVIQWCVDSGIYPALFAFTPIRGTALEGKTPPSLSSYRRAQVTHFLLTTKQTWLENMRFDKTGKLIEFGVPQDVLLKIIESGKPFLTSGCPGCNRPFYNERPGGPLYNYPRHMQIEEIEETKKILGF
jgi:biotin synthase